VFITPPQTKVSQVLTSTIVNALASFLASNSGLSSTVFIAGDFNTYDGSRMETQYGLVQVVVTHGSNILDKFCTNKPYMYHASLIKINTWQLWSLVTILCSLLLLQPLGVR